MLDEEVGGLGLRKNLITFLLKAPRFGAWLGTHLSSSYQILKDLSRRLARLYAV